MLKDLIYLIIIVAAPLPSYPLVVIFFNSNNLIYSVTLYIVALQVIYLSIYFFCKYFRFQYHYRKIPNIFPFRLSRIIFPFANDLLKGDLLKIISVFNIIQVPVLAVGFLFGYYETKLISVILFGIYVGLVNSLTYIFISVTGKSLLASLGIPESETINDAFSYFIIIISLLYIIFTQRKSFMKRLKALNHKRQK